MFFDFYSSVNVYLSLEGEFLVVTVTPSDFVDRPRKESDGNETPILLCVYQKSRLLQPFKLKETFSLLRNGSWSSDKRERNLSRLTKDK